jgi:8-oxo-dGTP diphosphatase
VAEDRPTLRNSAKAVIIENGYLLLIVNRGVKEERFYALPGGGQEGGETLHQALRRECLEEIGAEVEMGELLYLREYIGRNHEFAAHDGGSHQVEFMFACRLKTRPSHDAATVPDAWQIGVEWMPLDQLERVLLYPQALIPYLMDGDEHLGVDRPIYLGDVN